MSDETLGLFIRRYIEDVTAPQVIFTWQCCEPMLYGLDFLRLLKRFDMPFNTLTCVHRFNARRLIDNYRFLRVFLNQEGGGL